MDDSDVECTASILASVKEQEAQFEKLTRALEEERRHVSAQLERVRITPDGTVPLVPNGGSSSGTLTRRQQNGRLVGDAEFERQKLMEPSLNGPQDRSRTQYSTMSRMDEPGHVIEESYTVEEDPDGGTSVVSVEMSEDGTTRRTETTVKKVVKTVTTRTVVPVAGDNMSDISSIQGSYIQTLDRKYRGVNDGYAAQPGTATVPRNYHYADNYGRPYDDGYPPMDNYSSLSRTARMDDRYRPQDTYRTLDGYRAPSRQELYGPQPQVRMGSNVDINRLHPERFIAESYGLEDDQRSLGYDDMDYSMASDYGRRVGTNPRNRIRSYEDALDDAPSDQYYWAPLARHEAGSMASLDSLRKAPQTNWRQPELPEVIAMLNFRLDAVKSNAAAYLQHLCFRNDKVKTDVRRLKGIPTLVSLLDHPKKEVHYSACGALKNISYGRDPDNKIAIKNSDGVPALVRLLRKTRDMDVTEVITGTLWNLSSHDSIKMEIVDHALNSLVNEVIIPHSGWEREPNEDSKPRHVEWEPVLTNTAGCLRNVSSERSEARRKLRECDGLVDALLYIVQSEIGQKDLDSKLVENCVCLQRNLSYQIHREIPNSDRYIEVLPNNTGPGATGKQKASCFGTKKDRDKKNEDPVADTVDFPKRNTPAKGYELLFQPEVVRIYMSLLKESKNPAVVEAAAGAIQNLCAGRWIYGRCIRAAVRQERGLSAITEHLHSEHDHVVRAVSGALRNLAVDTRNKELIGKHGIPNLASNLPRGQPGQEKKLSEDTIVSVLNTINEVVGHNLEAAKKLRETQGIEKLVLINKSGNRSEREVKAAGLILQTVWGFKELRKPLEKEGWKKTDFQVQTTANRDSNRQYDDSTLPLIEKNQKGDKKNDRDMIPMNDIGPDPYSTLDQRESNRTLDRSGDLSEREPLQK
ncbi:catenin delta-1 [Protopterus annectens]|uniref:catenin delta-1 n=1 Tax=Protopterus annectens TaxID=7888 RepID=UPI001CFBA95E|nr:catenin delta-1 [Protopterus annectens]